MSFANPPEQLREDDAFGGEHAGRNSAGREGIGSWVVLDYR